MYTTNEQLKQLVCHEMPKGIMGVVVRTQTIPTMPKTRNGNTNPYHGRVIKYTEYVNIAIGYGYSQYANAQLTRKFGKPTKGNGMGERNGGFYTDYENGTQYPIFRSMPMKGKKWNEGMYALISHSTKDESKEYLRVTLRPNTTKRVIYFLDGLVVTEPNIIQEISAWENKHEPRYIYGLEGVKVEVKDITLDNVYHVACGKHYFNRFGIQQ